MSTKKISINPEFFKLTNVSGTKKEKKKKKKDKHTADLLKPNLKKELINKVNEHRKNIQKDKIKKEVNDDVKEIPNNLDQSLEYLNNLAKKNVDKKKKKKEKKLRNKTVKTFNIVNPYLITNPLIAILKIHLDLLIHNGKKHKKIEMILNHVITFHLERVILLIPKLKFSKIVLRKDKKNYQILKVILMAKINKKRKKLKENIELLKEELLLVNIKIELES